MLSSSKAWPGRRRPAADPRRVRRAPILRAARPRPDRPPASLPVICLVPPGFVPLRASYAAIREAANRGFRPPSARAKAESSVRGLGKNNKWPSCSFRSHAGSMTACSRSTPARSKSTASISISSPSISRARSSTGWRAARSSTSPSFRARNSSSASPTSSARSWPFRYFPRARFATASSPSTARRASRRPKDLEGKRVGVPLLTMTAAIYINGLLQHEYGVDLRKIHWVQGAMNTGGAHGSPTVLPLLKPMPIEQNTIEQIDERSDRGTRGRRHAGHQPARGDPHQPGHRAAVPELRGAGEGVLQAHQDLSDHAPGRHPQAGLREISRSSRPASTTPSANPRRSRWRKCSTCARCAT